MSILFYKDNNGAIMRFLKFFTICFSFILFSSSLVWAEAIEIYSPETDNFSELTLAYGETAELTVYLKSFGDLVSDYGILLFNNDKKLIGKGISDVNGVVIFTKVPAGKYRLAVERKLNDRGGVTMVSVGDIRIEKTKSEQNK